MAGRSTAGRHVVGDLLLGDSTMLIVKANDLSFALVSSYMSDRLAVPDRR